MHECTGWQSIQTRNPCTHAYMRSITSCGRIIQQPYPYISSSKFSANWCPTCYLCRDGCWIMRPHYVIMWSTYLHVCMDFLFVYLSASTFVHWAIPTCGGFLFRNLFYGDLFLFLKIFFTRCRPRICSWCIICARVHSFWRMRPTASTSVFPARKRKQLSPVTLKTKLKRHIPR